MAFAKEYQGRKFFSPITSHYILFLGHCQPIKQSFQKVDKGKKEKKEQGQGKGGEEGQE